MTLVSTEWLSNNLSKVKIFDASWHIPNSNRNRNVNTASGQGQMSAVRT